jgi:hypothetical protein
VKFHPPVDLIIVKMSNSIGKGIKDRTFVKRIMDWKGKVVSVSSTSLMKESSVK